MAAYVAAQSQMPELGLTPFPPSWHIPSLSWMISRTREDANWQKVWVARLQPDGQLVNEKMPNCWFSSLCRLQGVAGYLREGANLDSCKVEHFCDLHVVARRSLPKRRQEEGHPGGSTSGSLGCMQRANFTRRGAEG